MKQNVPYNAPLYIPFIYLFSFFSGGFHANDTVKEKREMPHILTMNKGGSF